MKQSSRVLIVSLIVVAAAASVGLTVAARLRSADADAIDTFTVRIDELTETVSGTGSFVPSVRRTVFSQVTGLVEEVFVDEGDVVDSGARLLHIDDEQYVLNLERAQITYRSTRRASLQQILNLQSAFGAAERAARQVRRTNEKNVALRSADAISLEQFQQSEEALAEATEALRSAREQLNLYTGRPLTAEPIRSADAAEVLVDEVPEVVQAALAVRQAEDALADTVARAPTAGTVAQVAVETGSLVAPNAPLVRVERLDSMNAEIHIDEVDIGKISVGNTAEIRSDSFLGRSLSGEVVAISPTIHRVGNTRVSTVDVSVDSGERMLKSGASCTVRISTTTKERALVIPITAYRTEQDETFVYVLDPDGDDYRLRRREIELGIVTVNLVEVVEGLEEGEVIADGNIARLREGMVVGREEEE